MQKEVYEFISKKTNDPIIERRTCRVSGEEFAIFQGDKNMLDMLSPVMGGKKWQLPLPELTRQERQKEMMVWRNDRSLYRGISDLTGDSLISMYHPSSPYKIYTIQERRSDAWDACDYEKEVDLSRSLFEQLQELRVVVPHMALINDNMSINSQYVNQAAHMKNCYLTFNSDNAESCWYCWVAKYSKYCVDSLRFIECENCYQIIDCRGCYEVQYGLDCFDCKKSMFLAHCRNCSDCFGCVNLVNKQYCFFNEQLTKDEYEQKIQSINLGSRKVRDEWLSFFEDHIRNYPKPATLTKQVEHVLGNLIENGKDGFFCFELADFKNCRYCTGADTFTKHSMDYTVRGQYAERIYRSITVGENANNIFFSVNCRPDVTNLFYCDECAMCKDCFGCVGLKNKQYCILNKQYTKKEYFEMLGQIIPSMQKSGEWGNFFPREDAPFAYNEAVGYMHYPINKEQALKQGYRWQDIIFDINIDSNIDICEHIGDDINEASNDIIDKIFRCPESGRFFKITKSELSFYRKYSIPLPIYHSDTRFYKNFDKRPGTDLHLRVCNKTGEEIISVYPADSSFEVYSEEAYRQEVYG